MEIEEDRFTKGSQKEGKELVSAEEELVSKTQLSIWLNQSRMWIVQGETTETSKDILGFQLSIWSTEVLQNISRCLM